MLTVLCLLCAWLAVWWAVGPPPRPSGSDLPSGSDGPSGSYETDGSGGRAGGRGVPRWLVLGALASGTFLAATALYDGVRGVVLGLGVLVLAWTVVGLSRERSRRRLALRRRTEVAQACAALAAQLRIGQVPSVALATAAVDHPVLRDARAAQELGGEVTRVWRAQSDRPGFAGLLELARAWQVSTRTGAPMSAMLEQVATALAAEQSVQAVVASELSAPRATGKVMAVLPVCGVGLGYLLGGEPIGWLVAGPLGWGCLLGGVVLACLGVLWIEALARQAAG